MNAAVQAISTHAPAGGATKAAVDMLLAADISTHAPAGGATFMPYSFHAPIRFLLTPLREGRPSLQKTGTTDSIFLLTPLREGRHASGLSPFAGIV